MEGFNFSNSVNDRDESLRSEEISNDKFGLNQSVKVLEVGFGEDRHGNPAFNLSLESKGKYPNNMPIYDIDVARDADNNEVRDKDSEVFKEYYAKNIPHNMAAVVHAVKAFGVTQEQIDRLVKGNTFSSFNDWAKGVCSLLPSNAVGTELDVFMEYQYNLGTRDKTYLQIPRNLKGGYFLCPATRQKWTEQREWQNDRGETVTGLRYVDEKGNVHMFERSQSFMESNKANQQVKEKNTSFGAPQAGQKGDESKKSTWT